jgi:hypothetical protein
VGGAKRSQFKTAREELLENARQQYGVSIQDIFQGNVDRKGKAI